jgi:hypothetical protein
MQRTALSFSLAILSLLMSYAIVAAWPDKFTPGGSAIAQVSAMSGVAALERAN